MAHFNKNSHKGWLFKWTNYWKGYQRRWFVLHDGCLSYYRNQTEMGHTCRGTISLVNSKIEPLLDTVTFMVSNGAAQTYHLRAANEQERKHWITVLLQARDNASKTSQSNQGGESFVTSQGVSCPEEDEYITALRQRLNDLETCERLVCQKGEMLLRGLCQLEENLALCCGDGHESLVTYSPKPSSPSLEEYTSVKEKATTFKVTVNAMVNSISSFVEFAKENSRHWQRQLSHEKAQRTRMEQMVEELAKQHSALERRVQMQSSQSAMAQQLMRNLSQSPSAATSTNMLMTHATGSVSDSCLAGVIAHGQETSPSTATASFATPKKSSMPTESEEDDEAFFDALPPTEEFEADTFCVSLPALPRDVTNVNNATVPDGGPNVTSDEALSYCSGSSDEGEDYAEAGSGTSGSTSGKDALKVVRVITRKTNRASKQQPSNSAQTRKHRRSDSQQSGTVISTELQQATKSKDEKHSPASKRPPAVPASTPEVVVQSTRAPSIPSRRQRRTEIPFRPNISVNLWSIMKNCIGKELTKIPIPVNFNEPLSMLQRVIEDYEYSTCLDAAARCSDSIEQMAYVAAFSVTGYSTTKLRTGKPFNPLLGETYECDRREDFGWRAITEQVSHHPPALAVHCESSAWTCWQEFTLSSKFRGKYLSIVPQGTVHLNFNHNNNHYTWNKVTTTVHNIIVGRLWIDNHGEMDLFNHTTGDSCHLSYKAYSYFSRDEPRRVMGVIYDRDKQPRYMLRGTWDAHMEGAPITAIRHNDWETGPWTTLWRKSADPEESAQMYNFTRLAIQLNEPEEGVPPTDSRLRPDLRLMEQGRWDEANKEKERLEEKQRAKRRATQNARSVSDDSDLLATPASYEPMWFKPSVDPLTGKKVHLYNGLYWERKEKSDWRGCPDIF